MKTRVKMRQMPGDVSKQEKAAMMEGKSKRVSRSSAKKWKKTILSRERAVRKRQQKYQNFANCVMCALCPHESHEPGRCDVISAKGDSCDCGDVVIIKDEKTGKVVVMDRNGKIIGFQG